jgi:PiT family inorganic phosphate transporter
MGVGATKRVSAVKWGLAGRIVIAWVVTIPATALVSAGVYWVVNLIAHS